MKLLDLSLRAPEQNLALDEALLDACERGEIGETLRFWEADRPFVVLGLGNRVESDVSLSACRRLGVPVFRRCTGGGAVLQAAGCLNYALVIRADRAPDLQSVTRTNRFVMERHRAALASLVAELVTVEGVTDLALDGCKVSGNAQRRQRRAILFHGTFLLALDLELMEQVLMLPNRRPAYRADRSHRDFLRTLPVSSAELKVALRRVWSADAPLENPPLPQTNDLAREKYSTPAWTFRS